MIILELLFWLLALLVAYVYVGYPLSLILLRKIAGVRAIAYGDSEPSVTLIISAFNEADVIGDKIRNSLEIDYPREKLEVLVVSDASDDGTDEIVNEYSTEGLVLLRMEDRGGKTLGLNAAVLKARGDVLIFSDANAMYRSDAVRNLLRNFDDPDVGAVVGESTYFTSANDAEKSESAYWRYETGIKLMETQLGSVVGGDGAIYAIRKELYRPMAADALSDFVNPLQIVEQGKRCVYEPKAISEEDAAGSFDKEFRRKVRIVNRAWRATMTMKRLLNPFQYGLFSWMLISHKLLRWLVPVFLVGLFVLNLLLVGPQPLYYVPLGLQLCLYAVALIGASLHRSRDLSGVTYIPYYFCLVNIASARGIYEAYRGKTYTTWSTARAGTFKS